MALTAIGVVAGLAPTGPVRGAAPVIRTDKPDYAPSDTVHITGSNFQSGGRYAIPIRRPDGTFLKGDGSGQTGWDFVTADGLGNITYDYILNGIPGTYEARVYSAVWQGGWSAKPLASVIFTDSALEQCKNGGVGDPAVSCTTSAAWAGGNANEQNSHWGEGQSVPYRLGFSGVAPGAHTVTISYDSTKDGSHAFDYLTTVNRTETTANECVGITLCTLATYSAWPIPVDSAANHVNVADNNVLEGFDQVDNSPVGCLGGDDICQVPGEFRLHGATITGVSKYTLSGTYAGTSTTSITISFTATAANDHPVLAFSGHIASRADWVPGTGAGAINGSPYHMSSSEGGELSMKAAAIVLDATVTIRKASNPQDPQDFAFTATGLPAGSFTLDDASPDDADAFTNERTFSPVTLGTKTITESAVGGWSLGSITCLEDVSSTGQSVNVGSRSVSFNLEAEENVLCTFTNNKALNGTIIIRKQTTPNGAAGSFGFTSPDIPAPDNSFSLSDDGVRTISGVPAGTYHVTEGSTTGYTLESLVCTDPTTNTTIAGSTATINLAAGETVDCTYTNSAALSLSVTKVPTPSALTETGGSVSYAVGVTNTSPVSVTLDSLVDDKFANLNTLCSIPVGGVAIAAGATFNCTFSGNIAAQQPGTHVNTVTASAHDAANRTVTGQQSATVTINSAAPTITVNKTGPATIAEPGGTVTYTVTVTNTSSSTDPVTITSLVDNPGNITLAGDADCQVGTVLAPSGPGSSCTFDFTGPVTGNAGQSKTDTVTATVNDDDTPATSASANDNHTVTITDVAPTITVDKTGPATIAEPGGNVTYSVTITNTSPASTDPITIESLVDDTYGVQTGDADCQVGTVLAKNASCNFTFVGAVLGNAGHFVTDVVTVTFDDNDTNTNRTKTDNHTVTVVGASPSITVNKTGPATIAEPGGTVTYTVTVTNTSSSTDPVTITSLVDNPGNITLAGDADCQVGTVLAPSGPGSSCTFDFTGPVTGNAGQSKTDTVTATVNDDDTPATSASANDNHTVTITDVAPTITVDKTGPATIAEPGGNVTYSVTITNTSPASTDPITIESLVDDTYGVQTGDADCQVGTVLAKNASCNFTFVGAVLGNAGHFVTDVVTVTFDDNDTNTNRTKTDNHTVTVVGASPSITVNKTGPATIAEPGGTVTYTVTVTNTSSSTDPVTITSLVDNPGNITLAGDADCQVGTVLAPSGPGSSCTFDFTGPVTGNAGQSKTDTVTATVNDDDTPATSASANDNHTVTITDVAPTITVDKTGPATIAEPGGNVTYSVTITNTSPASTDPITIESLVDDTYGVQTGDADCQVGTVLAKNASCNFTFVGAVLGNAGHFVTDVVTVTFDDNDTNTNRTKTDNHTVTVVGASPSITVNKTGPATIAEPGGTVTYTVTVTNTSSSTDPVTITSLVDNPGNITLAGDADCQVGTVLAPSGPGSSCTFDFTGPVTGNAGQSKTDTVTATVNDDDTPATSASANDNHTVTITDVAPTITVDKTGPATIAEPGGNVTYSVTITNTSPASTDPITIESLVDDTYGVQTGDADCQVGTVLAKNASCNFTFVGAVLGNAGHFVTDVVTVTFDDNDTNTNRTKTDNHTVTVVGASPSITVNKTGPATIAEPGGTVTYTVTVTNTSSSTDPVTITSLVDNPGNITLAGDADCQVGTVLAPSGPGSSCTFDFTGPVTGDAGDSETDTVTVTVRDDDTPATTATGNDNHTVTIANTGPPSALSVTKTPNQTSVNETGAAITMGYTVTVTNPSAFDTVTLTSISDSPSNNLDLTDCDKTVLGPNETATCTFSGIVGPQPGNYPDTVNVAGTDDDGDNTSGTASANVLVNNVGPSTFSVTKSATPNPIPEPGGTLTYTVVVKNNSTIDSATINSITDDKFGTLAPRAGSTCTVPQTLAPQGTYTCTFTANVTGKGDSTHTNTVTASGTDDDGDPITGSGQTTVTISDIASSIDVIKTATPTTVLFPGGNVLFKVKVTNTSQLDTVTLTSLVDDVYGDLTVVPGTTCSVPQTLAPGAVYNCQFTGFVGGNDGDSKYDVVTVTGIDDDDKPVTDFDDACVKVLKASGRVTTSASTCAQFKAGTATDVTELLYGVVSGKTSATTPANFFYYSDVVAPATTFSVKVLQSDNSALFGVLAIDALNTFAYDANCVKVNATKFVSNGVVTFTISNAVVGQHYYIATRYTTAALNNVTIGTTRPTAKYTFQTNVNNVLVETSPDSVDVKPKP